ncbi:LytR/AlgR family response regulator transcription factor [Sphingobacterium sp. LRF_L2]|uniref:LytR/AlgR family response regulator transcription factor n=1 Tax=Sphingobacterium sp. LRF_L2 TaxID=3369421 RepID=UPI003F5E5063
MKCIIIDDEPLAREGLQNVMLKFPNVEIRGSFHNSRQALQMIEQEEIDLVFLDIEMPQENGLVFAKKIPDKTLIIFVTAYPQYALEGFELEAMDYLVKPVSEERFAKAIAKAQSQLELLNPQKQLFDLSTQQYIMVKADRKLQRIYYNDILYIEALKDYSVLHTNNANKIITALNLKTLHAKLPDDIFIRVSKSYIVQKNAVDSFTNSAIIIVENEIPLGKSYRTDFFKFFSS